MKREIVDQLIEKSKRLNLMGLNFLTEFGIDSAAKLTTESARNSFLKIFATR